MKSTSYHDDVSCLQVIHYIDNFKYKIKLTNRNFFQKCINFVNQQIQINNVD